MPDLLTELVEKLNLTLSIDDKNFKGCIRVNRVNLNTLGDISVVLNSNAWPEAKHDILKQLQTSGSNIFERISQISNQICLRFHSLTESYVSFAADRPSAIFATFSLILKQNDKYGHNEIFKNKSIALICNESTLPKPDQDLSQLRLSLLQTTGNKLLAVSGCDCVRENGFKFMLTTNSNTKVKNTLLCGVVLEHKTKAKLEGTTAKEYYEKRTSDVRLIVEHKYGINSSTPDFSHHMNSLGRAAVTFDFLQVKPSSTVTINVVDPTAHSSKGALFVLYNYARISEMLNEFPKKVATNYYKNLVDLEDIDFSVLSEKEEWEISFGYLMHYPAIVKQCIEDIENNRFSPNLLCSFLSGLSSIFSAYYRRVKIFRISKEHLIPVLHARIYFLKAVRQVMLNTLGILNIDPIQRM